MMAQSPLFDMIQLCLYSGSIFTMIPLLPVMTAVDPQWQPKIHPKHVRWKPLPFYNRNFHRRHRKQLQDYRRRLYSYRSDVDSTEAASDACYRVIHHLGYGHHFSQMIDDDPDLLFLFGTNPGPISKSPICSTEYNFYQGKLFDWQGAYITSNSDPIIFDTGASISVSPHRNDFLDFTPSDPKDVSLTGLNGETAVKGTGVVEYVVTTDAGDVRRLKTQAYFVPSADVRLFSVQRYLQPDDSGQLTITGKKSFFEFPWELGGGRITFQLSTTGNLPIA